jgi:GDPmannose 4,6-dehydratase
VSFDIPEYTGNITALSTIRLLEAIRRSGQKVKFYQASSSEMFGAAKAPQSEDTPFQPQSPYACAKVYAYWIAKNYREGYGIFACNGMLFNHESPRRGETFVTRKITRTLADILAGKQKKLYLGYLDAKRDWGFAPEYVEAMWLILQQKKADDYVIGTGESHTVREFVEAAFNYAGINISWHGKDTETKGVVDSLNTKMKVPPFLKKGSIVVEIDKRYFRPNEVDYLRADIAKAKKQLNWQPRVKFGELIKIMVDYDLKNAGINPPDAGVRICKQKRFSYINHDFCCRP